jgi:hypothetical protein
MKRRTRRRVPATITAVVLLAFCVAVTVFAVQTILGRTTWVSLPALSATRWTDPVPVVVAVVVAALGLVLLFVAVWPGKVRIIPLAGPLPAGAARHTYRGALRAAASTVDGVTDARVRLRRQRVLVRISTQRPEVADVVRAAVERRVDAIGPAVRPTVRVRVR